MIQRQQQMIQQQQQIMQQQQQQLHFQNQHRHQQKSLATTLKIPEVPAAIIPKAPMRAPSLKIPEVPRGFVSAATNIDRINRAVTELKTMDKSNSSAGTNGTLPTVANSNRPLDSFLVPQYNRQVLPQVVYRAQHAALLPQQQQPHPFQQPYLHLPSRAGYQHQPIDLASSSGASDCDHSEATLKRRNGQRSTASSPTNRGRQKSSPIFFGTIYTTTAATTMPEPNKKKSKEWRDE